MSDEGCSGGEGLARAMARAEALRRSSPRSVRVKIVTRHGDLDPGVIVVAHIAAKTGPELEAQVSKGVRHVPLAQLDVRSHELCALVDEAAAEVEAAVEAPPPAPQRPSRREVDSAATEAVALAALKVAALSAHGGRIELADLYEMLNSETSNCGDTTVGIGLNDKLH